MQQDSKLVPESTSKISLTEVLDFRAEMYNRSIDLIEKKGHDYNRQQQFGGDTLFNLKVCAILGIVSSPEVGILVRLSDKFMRLVSLIDIEGKNEPFEDTVIDSHNYLDYLALLRRKRLSG